MDDVDIYPLHVLDAQYTFNLATPGIILRFEDVLDAEMLKRSLEELVQTGGWRKVGARLKRNAKTKGLEYHIPRDSSHFRAATALTIDNTGMLIAAHSLGSQLAQVGAGTEASYHGDPTRFLPLSGPPDGPRDFNDWVDVDRPLLAIHVVSFTDATLLSIKWPHNVTDGGGVADFLWAWSAQLRGEPVPQEASLVRDAMCEALGTPNLSSTGWELKTGSGAEEPEEQFVHAHRTIKGVGLVLLAVRILVDTYLYPMEKALVFIPRTAVQRMRAAAVELIQQSPELAPGGLPEQEGQPGVPFLSPSDVISAWLVRHLSAAIGEDSTRDVGVQLAMDIRKRTLAQNPATAGDAFLQNAMTIAYFSSPIADMFPEKTKRLRKQDCDAVKTSPYDTWDGVAIKAAHFRQAIAAQTTPNQMKAWWRLAARSATNAGRPPIYGPASTVLTTVTNWSALGLVEKTDFSPAVKQTGNRPLVAAGRPVMYYNSGSVHSFFMQRNFICIMGLPNGDFLVSAFVPPKATYCGDTGGSQGLVG